jgi:hypothetical protein
MGQQGYEGSLDLQPGSMGSLSSKVASYSAQLADGGLWFGACALGHQFPMKHGAFPENQPNPAPKCGERYTLPTMEQMARRVHVELQ